LAAKAVKRRLGVAILGGLAATLAGVGTVQGSVQINTCGYAITLPGTYILAADLTQCPADGIDIATSNVVLKLDGILFLVFHPLWVVHRLLSMVLISTISYEVLVELII
jgi:hypothetical protein